MKKILVSLLVPLCVMTIIVFVPDHATAQNQPVMCPVGYACTPLPACPQGYVCTPVVQIPGCPTGYFCTQINTTTVKPSACYVFQTNLSLGSKGADVVALQTILIAGGFDINSISSGSIAKGVFDRDTETAVKKYQSSIGVPSTGFVGPLTRGYINSQSCSNTGQGGTVANTALSATLVSSSQNLTTYQLKTGQQSVNLNYVYLYFSTKAWTYSDRVQVSDGSKVLWSKSVSAADFVELPNNGGYLLQVPAAVQIGSNSTLA